MGSIMLFLIFFIRFCFTQPGTPPSENEPFVFTKITDAIFNTQYDAIIVGGGASGCPLARTLAEANKTVLLIERGESRHASPDTLGLNGTGWVINNPKVSQLIITEEGIRSHVASVLSGGTGINMGIAIAETNDYFESLNKLPNVYYNITKFNEALDWAVKTFAFPWPQSYGFSTVWRNKLQELFKNKNISYSIPLLPNDTWSTYSLFNSKQNFSRFAADHALIDPPPTLTVLLNHTVHKIETIPINNGQIRATCVLLQETLPEDIAPIIAKSSNESYRITQHFKNVLGFLFHFKSHRDTKKPYNTKIPIGSRQYRICVNSKGIIVSSAGAVLTPILMYKSGIGPKEFVANANVSPLIKQLDGIGKNLKDRVFIPISLLVKENATERNNFEPSIASTVALGVVGRNCSRKTPEKCSFSPIEELGGGHLSEGAMIASRMVIPAEIRNLPATDVALTIYSDCKRNEAPLGHDWLKPMCSMQKHAESCFQRIVSFFYFTAEPKSLGELKVLPNGQVSVFGHYLENPEDLEDAAHGLSQLVQILNTSLNDTTDGLFESNGFNCIGIILTSRFLDAVGTRYDMLAKLRENENGYPNAIQNQNLKQNADIYGKLLPFRYVSQILTWLFEQKPSGAQFFRECWKVFDFTRQFREDLTGIDYSSYPLQIPQAEDYEGLKRYAKTWMTSIWHWTGSASMGVVVDKNFKVYGFENLHIVDASVLNKATRMNPSITILSLGRYAGLILSEIYS